MFSQKKHRFGFIVHSHCGSWEMGLRMTFSGTPVIVHSSHYSIPQGGQPAASPAGCQAEECSPLHLPYLCLPALPCLSEPGCCRCFTTHFTHVTRLEVFWFFFLINLTDCKSTLNIVHRIRHFEH